MKTIAEQLKHTRDLLGFTQEEMARTLQVKRATYGAWEEGRANPGFDTLKLLKSKYKIDIYQGVQSEYNLELDVQTKYDAAPDAVKKIIDGILNL